MGLSRELEALKRRANRAALATRMPDIEILVYHEGDEIPEASSDWALRVMIEMKRDYYEQGTLLSSLMMSRPFREKTPRNPTRGFLLGL